MIVGYEWKNGKVSIRKGSTVPDGLDSVETPQEATLLLMAQFELTPTMSTLVMDSSGEEFQVMQINGKLSKSQHCCGWNLRYGPKVHRQKSDEGTLNSWR